MRHLSRIAACALLAATSAALAGAPAAAATTSKSADQTDDAARVAGYLDALRDGRSASGSETTSGGGVRSEVVAAPPDADRIATRAFQGITDPRFDVGDARADIFGAAIQMDADGLTGLLVNVAAVTNPNTDIGWWLYDSGVAWELDVNGNGNTDYLVAILNDGVEAWAGVLDTATRSIACFADGYWDRADSYYGVVFETSCMANPVSARWRVTVAYETASSLYLDTAPDNNAWAGPAVNSAVGQPAPTPAPAPAPEPPTPTPSPDPAPAPGPVAPAPVPQRCPSPVSKPSPSTGDDPIRTVDPARVFDSRVGGGLRGGGSITRIKIAGCANVPPDSVGAILNVTALDAQAPGYLTVFPCGTSVPDASNVNYTTGQTVPNTAVARLSGDGSVCVYTSADTGLLVDVTGYLPAGSDVAVRSPSRFLDTRSSGGPVGAGSIIEIAVAGRPGAPADVAAVVLNVTALDAQAPGYLTVFPCGTSVPDASNVNYTTGQTVPNAVIARVGAAGTVCVYTSAAAGLIVDAAGFVPAGSAYAGVNPARMHDTRSVGGARGAGSVTEVQIAGRAGIPAAATTAVLNVTALGAQAPGYLTVFPCGTSVPDASNVNYTTGQTVPNAVVAKIGAGGKVCVFTSAASGLIVDAAGYAP